MENLSAKAMKFMIPLPEGRIHIQKAFFSSIRARFPFKLLLIVIAQCCIFFVSGTYVEAGQYLNQEQEYAIEPPSGWQVIPPSTNNKMVLFQRDPSCAMAIIPGGKGKELTPLQFADAWENVPLGPGKDFSRRIERSTVKIAGYNSVAGTYVSGKGSSLMMNRIYFIGFPGQVLIGSFSCAPADFSRELPVVLASLNSLLSIKDSDGASPYVEHKSGYSIVPPANWLVRPPDANNALTFLRDCSWNVAIWITPADLGHHFTLTQFADRWEQLSVGKGKSYKRRLGRQMKQFNGVPADFREYAGTGIRAQIVFLEYPQTIIVCGFVSVVDQYDRELPKFLASLKTLHVKNSADASITKSITTQEKVSRQNTHLPDRPGESTTTKRPKWSASDLLQPEMAVKRLQEQLDSQALSEDERAGIEVLIGLSLLSQGYLVPAKEAFKHALEAKPDITPDPDFFRHGRRISFPWFARIWKVRVLAVRVCQEGITSKNLPRRGLWKPQNNGGCHSYRHYGHRICPAGICA